MNASSPTSLLEAMILAHDLIVLVSENTKKKISHVTLRVLGGRVPALQNFLRWGRGPHRYK